MNTVKVIPVNSPWDEYPEFLLNTDQICTIAGGDHWCKIELTNGTVIQLKMSVRAFEKHAQEFLDKQGE